jgi:dTDP-4-dehydrorhamnose reductase
MKNNSGKTMQRILVTGASGYIGSNLRKYLKDKRYDVYGVTSKEVQEEKLYKLDITEHQNIFNIINDLKPDIIIHTAGLNSLSECEKNHGLAMKINIETTENIIQAICNIDPTIKLVFISSDYVFDGKKGNYREEDETNPQTFYGKTKAQSENDVRKHLGNYIICRTANVYGRGGNFFNFVLDALEQNKTIDVFNDVFYTPTYIDYFLGSLSELIDTDYKGIIHIAGKERLSRYDFGSKMAEILGKDKTLIKPVKQQREGLIAKDSSLNCEYSRKILNNYWPSLEESLNYCFGNLVPPYFFFADSRGSLTGILQDQKWEEINYIESVKGSIRGNHYHKETKEAFFIIEGEIKISLIDIINNSKRTFISKKGDILIVNPYILHTFEVLKDSKWINMLSKPLKGKEKDIHRDYPKS